jgi:hypothetical protein
VGKTVLIEQLQKRHKERRIFYSQAIEGPEALQVSQICSDMQPLLPDIALTNWLDFFKLLASVTEPTTVVFDEFPYLVKTQPSLPSILQRWLDHQRPAQMQLIILGSSQTMMHDTFLAGSSPLYERANEIIFVQPMSYRYFCEAKSLEPMDHKNYLKYSMVGGVPKYWEFIDAKSDVISVADKLFFESGARLEYEPDRLLKDENIRGEQGKAILELIGRGAHRPSEMANRLGMKQTSLSPPLQLLREASLIKRDVPFGESVRSTKRTLFRIEDHCLRFWYSVYSPNRSIWSKRSTAEKMKLIKDHAAESFEADYRKQFLDAQRYWESDLEFDSVRYADATKLNIIISELKFRKLSSPDRNTISQDVLRQFSRSKLAQKYKAEVEVIDIDDGLKSLAALDD